MLALACVLAWGAPRAAHAAKSDSATQTVRINADSALYSLEDEIITIDGNVSIESGDLKVRGAKLVYSNTTHIAVLSGSPVVLTRGKTTKATAGRIQINLDESVAKAWDGISLDHRDGPVTATFKCASMDMNYQTGDVTARVGVEMTYRDEDQEKAFREKKKKSRAGDTAALNVAVSPARISAGQVSFNLETSALRAGQVVHVALPELTLDATDVHGNLKEKYLEAAGGIHAEMNDMNAKAGRAVIYYGKRQAVFEKGVRATRGADVMTGERVEMDYTPGKRTVRVKGPVDIQLKIPQDTGNGQHGGAGK
jgi:lipopolysaccharide export system protein LptA